MLPDQSRSRSLARTVLVADYSSPMKRAATYRGIDVVVEVTALRGRQMRWSFATTNNLTGDGVTTFGVEAAFRNGMDAAHVAIDKAVDW